MKKLFIPIFCLFLSSCAVSNYYQLFTASSDGGKFENKNIVFNDANCTVSYNLWSDGGNIGFNIYNKTDNDLELDLTKTFFVYNGVSYEYFQNRTFTKSSGSTSTQTYSYYRFITNSNTSINGVSTSVIEKPMLTIPPKTSINVADFNIVNTRFISCDLTRYPTSRTIKTMVYNKANSPINFYNIISYTIKGETNRFENRFYIDEITNYPSNMMFNIVDTNICGGRLSPYVSVLKFSSPNKFYFKYAIDK